MPILASFMDTGSIHPPITLLKRTLSEADKNFWTDFDRLASGNQIPVWLTLETSYIERGSTYSLWGLLVNSGYLTALERLDENTVIVRIPNDEVMSEFLVLITELGGMDGLELQQMFSCLLHRDTDRFLELTEKSSFPVPVTWMPKKMPTTCFSWACAWPCAEAIK